MSQEFSKAKSHDEDLHSTPQKIDPYRFNDPSGRSLKYTYPIRKFELTDVYLILGVFVVGFVFALILSNYYKLRKEKIDEINRKFQGLKGEYEHV